MPGPELTLAVRETLEMRPLAGLLTVLALVPLTQTQMVDRIDRELADNPMLERIPGTACPTCGRHISGYWCPECAQHARSGEEDFAVHDDELTTLASCEVDPGCRAALPLVLAHLTPRGLLDAAPADIAAMHDLPDPVVAECLRAIKAAGPPGIAETSVTQLLVAQSEALVREGAFPRWACELLERNLELVAAHDAARVAQIHGVTVEAASAVFELIAERLRPYVVANAAPAYRNPPEVIMRRDDGGRVRVEVPDSRWFGLRVAAIPGECALDPEAKSWLRNHQLRAHDFVSQVDSRASVLRRVVVAALDYQSGFVDSGPRAHRPLTRCALAEGLQLSVSTVSRAAKDKRIRLPDGRLIDMSCLFGKAVSVKIELAEFAEVCPRSDQELADLLSARGYVISRRTVAKYRAELGIPASGHRTTLR